MRFQYVHDFAPVYAVRTVRVTKFELSSQLPLALHNLLQKLRPTSRHGSIKIPKDAGTPANTPTTPGSPLDTLDRVQRVQPFPLPLEPYAGQGCFPFPLEVPTPVDLAAALVAVDAGTQTSPPLSRSSSFTWVSDCSSLPLPDTPDTPDTPGSMSEDDR